MLTGSTDLNDTLMVNETVKYIILEATKGLQKFIVTVQMNKTAKTYMYKGTTWKTVNTCIVSSVNVEV